MEKQQIKGKAKHDLDKLLKSALLKKFETATEKIKEAMIAQYDEELVDVVTDRESRTNPNFYRDDFIERLEEFSYIEENGDTLTLKIPDMETFDFSGRMRVIQAIMEGLPGLYVEMDSDEYKAAFGKPPINQEPLDEYVPPKERIYLVRYSNVVRKAEKDRKKKFIKYPFSNTPPIRVLEQGAKFVDENMSEWIEDALEEANRQFVRNYQGARL
jgi:hypothetical protein